MFWEKNVSSTPQKKKKEKRKEHYTLLHLHSCPRIPDTPVMILSLGLAIHTIWHPFPL
jgi:predicted nucleic acid-binding protein